MSAMVEERVSKGVVVVTGAAGFIGSSVCEYLLKRGEEVAGIDEINDYYDVSVKESNIQMLHDVGGSRFLFYKGDICDVELLQQIWETEKNPRRVVHMVARAGVRPSIDDPFVYVHSNVEGTTRLLEISRKYGSDSFVFASSSSVYGGSKKTLFSKSDAVDNPVSPYAATKKACELLAYTYHHLYKMNIAALRFFTVFGPRGRPDMAPLKFVDKISRGVPIQQFGDGSSSRDYTYIDDIVDGVVRSLDTPLGYQVYNLGNGEPTLLKDFIGLVEKETGKTAVIEVLPEQPGDVPRTCADISKARTLLGYDPKTPFPEGIKKLVSWYKQQHPEVDEVPECIARAEMNKRMKASARRHMQELDPELLETFLASKTNLKQGRSYAHTVERSDPYRALDQGRNFEKVQQDPRQGIISDDSSPTLIDRNTLDAFMAAVRQRPSHRGIPALATICSSKPTVLLKPQPGLSDAFAGITPTNSGSKLSDIFIPPPGQAASA